MSNEPTLGWYYYHTREYEAGVPKMTRHRVRVEVLKETESTYRVRTLQPMAGRYGAPTGSLYTPRKKSVHLDRDDSERSPSWLPYKD